MSLSLLPGLAEAFMLAFARIGTLVMLLPGFGERAVPARLRLALALLLTVLVQPLIEQAQSAALATLMGEIAVGAMLGGTTRLLLMAAETAGGFAAQGIGLSFAQMVDPSQAQNSDVLAAFFRMTAIGIVFAADLHHLAIGGIAGSYRALPPGSLTGTADGLRLFLGALAPCFTMALVLAAPFLVFGLVFNLGVGLIGRMAPQIQVFFLTIPVSVALGLVILGRALPSFAERWRDFAGATLLQLLPLP